MAKELEHWHCNNCETDNNNSLNECEVCGGIPPQFIDFSCVCYDINKPSLCKCHAENADSLFLQVDDGKPFEIFKDEIALDIKKLTTLTLIATNKITERRKSIKVEIEKPSIQIFEVSESSVLDGESVSVKWKVKNTEHCVINGAEMGCEGEENISACKKLTITAYNSTGEVSKSLHLTIYPRPDISFNASEQKLHAGKGEKVEISWLVENAVNVNLLLPDGTKSTFKLKDSIVLSPTDTSTYILQVTALDKRTTIDTPITINVYHSAQVEFSSDKMYVFPSIPFTLFWQVQHAKRITLNGKVVKARDSMVYEQGVEKDTTYTLRVTDEFGTKDYPLSIKMLPIPQIKTILVPMPEISKEINVSVSIPTPIVNLKFRQPEIRQVELPTQFGVTNEDVQVQVNEPKMVELNFHLPKKTWWNNIVTNITNKIKSLQR